MGYFVSIFLKFFFILTPFFVLSTFMAMTAEMDDKTRRLTAIKVTLAVAIVSMILIFSGKQIFIIFGFTLDSFRVGTGALLFLSAVKLINGNSQIKYDKDGDISVVPLAIPVTVGPATTGMLLVIGTTFTDINQWILGLSGIFSAIIFVGILLYCSSLLEKVIGKQGLSILSKITGLILAALSAEMVLSGVKGFFAS